MHIALGICLIICTLAVGVGGTVTLALCSQQYKINQALQETLLAVHSREHNLVSELHRVLEEKRVREQKEKPPALPSKSVKTFMQEEFEMEF